MRYVLVMLVLWFCFPACLRAQSVRTLSYSELVRLARSERARRVGQPEGRVYTTEDLRRFSPVPASEAPEAALGGAAVLDVEEEVGDETDEPLTAAVESDADPGFLTEQDWIDWEESVIAQQQQVEELERREARQQQFVDRLREEVSVPSENPPDTARMQLRAAEGGLEGLRTELEGARALLAALESTPLDAGN